MAAAKIPKARLGKINLGKWIKGGGDKKKFTKNGGERRMTCYLWD